MKKALIMSVLGATASLAMVATSNAAGYINFQNYDSGSGLNAPVTFASSGLTVAGGVTPSVAGYGVGSEFTADLLYSDAANGNVMTLLTSANAGTVAGAFGYPAQFTLSGLYADGPVDSVNHTGPGYFYGAGIKIPNYTSGPIWFVLEVYNGTSYTDTLGVGFYRAQSAPFEVNSLATGSELPGTFGPALQPFTVGNLTPPPISPEPATLALGGLGLAALLSFRRSRES